MEVGKELEEILNNDPLDLLKVGATASLITPDDRLIASFKEINDFFEAKGREPEKIREVTERTLFSRLEQLRKDPKNTFNTMRQDVAVNFKTTKNMSQYKEDMKRIDRLEDVFEVRLSIFDNDINKALGKELKEK